MARERYLSQVRLLVRTLPHIAQEQAFALKGGTAINLFYREMPRLSIDADLVYLPLQDREAALSEIRLALGRLGESVERGLPGARVLKQENEPRIEIRQGNAAVKVETSPVMRGTVHPPEVRRFTPRVEQEFGFGEMMLVSFEDLYAGKLVAALDRQHPRDLYDIKLLLEHEGLTDALFRTFLVYVASSNRPPHELLDPRRTDIVPTYRAEFDGMTTAPVPVAELEEARELLITETRTRLDDAAKRFLLSILDGVPDFESIGLPEAATLPAIRWKLMNLEHLRTSDPRKHSLQRAAIEELS